MQPQNKKPSEIEALRQGLDPPERFEFDSQADRELHRLGVKTKHLVDDWMEHYRIALGMASPAIKRMLEKPKVSSAALEVFTDVKLYKIWTYIFSTPWIKRKNTTVCFTLSGIFWGLLMQVAPEYLVKVKTYCMGFKFFL